MNSFCELCPKLLRQFQETEEDAYILSEVFSQDPLERYFSRQRQKGGSNDNPTVAQFRLNTANLVQQQQIYQDIKTMNVIADSSIKVTSSVVNQPLRKRRKTSK